MAKISNELKTGVFVVICIAALLFLTVKVGNFSFLQKGYELKARFNYVSGLEKSAPVRLSGVEVGQVKDITILYDNDTTQIELALWLDSTAKVRKDSLAMVSMLGLMGEKYIEITAGSPGEEFLKPGSLIPSEDPLRMEEITKIAKQIAAKLNDVLGDIQKLAKDVDGVVVDNRKDVDALIVNLKQTAINFNEFSEDIKQHPWKLLMKGKEEKPKKE